MVFIPPYTKNLKNIDKKILIVSGGGAKCIASIGALKVLSNHNVIHKIETFVGTSFGAFIIVMYIIGYDFDDIFELIKNMKKHQLYDIDLNTFLTSFGFDSKSKFDYIISRLMQNKNIDPNITFQSLYNITQKKIIITAVCINNIKYEMISYENFPDMQVRTALLMSMAVPVLFSPVIYNNLMYVDGGLIDNFPIAYFENNIDDVIGIYIYPLCNIIDNVQYIDQYIYQIFNCFLHIKDYSMYDKYCVSIKVDSTNVIDFNISDDTMIDVFNIGYTKMNEYISKM